MYRIVLLFALLTTIFLPGCYDDSVEELYPVSFGANCDTSGSSYSNDVQSTFATYNCSSCHSGSTPSAGIDLSSAAAIQSFINSQTTNTARLMGAIRHQAPYAAMPNAGTKIEKCSADRIEAWVLKGCPNN